MLDNRDWRFTFAHSLLHSSWLVLAYLLVAAIGPSHTIPFWIGICTLIPLLVILILSELAILNSNKPPRSMGNLFRWILGFSLLNYLLSSTVGLIFSAQAFEPHIYNCGSSVALGIFLLLNSGPNQRWYNRRMLYQTLGDRTKPLQDVLRPQQVLVGNAWKDLQSLQTQNQIILLSGLFLFLGARSSPVTEGIAVLSLVTLLGSALLCISTINHITFEHTLFALSCYPPQDSAARQGSIRFMLALLALVVAFLIPWKTSLIPTEFIFTILTGFFQFLVPDSQTMEQSLREVQERMGMQDTSFFQGLGDSAEGVSAIDLYGLLGTVIVGIWLFFLVLLPLYRNRSHLLSMLRDFFTSLWKTLTELFGRQSTKPIQGRRFSSKADSLKFTRTLVEKEVKKARAWNNQVIQFFAEWLNLWQKEGLILLPSMTVRDILAKQRQLTLLSSHIDVSSINSDIQKLEDDSASIGDLFLKEVFDRYGLDAQETRKLGELVKSTRSTLKILKTSLKEIKATSAELH